MVISPPPPNPVKARMMSSVNMFGATAQPKQPSMKVIVDTRKQTRLPKMSENRPYNGWKAVLVIRYDVVSHDALFAALKSELIRAYVDAVMVLSNPDKKALIHKADGSGVSKLANL